MSSGIRAIDDIYFTFYYIAMEIRKNPDIDVVELYRSGLSMADISSQAGITRQAVSKRLEAFGIARTRRSGRIPAICEHCGNPYLARRSSRISTTTRQRMCSQACYYASRSNPAFIENRAAGQAARQKAGHHFDLKPEYVVHHEDQNQTHNDLSNLSVFASQSEHLQYHHGRPIKPLWSGASCRCDLCLCLQNSNP